MSEPRNGLAILLIGSGFLTYSFVDVMAKLLTADLSPFQIVGVRQFGFLVFAVITVAVRGSGNLKSARPGLQLLRGTLMVVSAVAFIGAIKFIPLADAVAMSFMAPFFLTILGALWLGERVGPRRWAAVVIGFAGALVILRPGLGVVHPASALMLLASVGFALRQAISRVLARVDSTSTTVIWSGIVSGVVAALPLPFIWESPATAKITLLLCGVAVLAALGEFLVIRALEVGEAVAVAPVHYTLILYSTFWGWAIFRQFPDAWTWSGAAVIVASGAYTTYRERAAGRPAPPEPSEI